MSDSSGPIPDSQESATSPNLRGIMSLSTEIRVIIYSYLTPRKFWHRFFHGEDLFWVDYTHNISETCRKLRDEYGGFIYETSARRNSPVIIINIHCPSFRQEQHAFKRVRILEDILKSLKNGNQVDQQYIKDHKISSSSLQIEQMIHIPIYEAVSEDLLSSNISTQGHISIWDFHLKAMIQIRNLGRLQIRLLTGHQVGIFWFRSMDIDLKVLEGAGFETDLVFVSTHRPNRAWWSRRTRQNCTWDCMSKMERRLLI